MRRRSTLRIGGWVLVSSLTAVGLSLAYPGGPNALVDDVRNYGHHADELAAGEAATREIDAAISVRVGRQRVKAELCGQLACGGVRLRDAADEYLRAVAEDRELLALFRAGVPGPTDEQRVAAALVRDTFTTVPMSAGGQQSLLDQFRATYGSPYPLPVPATASASDPSQRP